MNELKQMIKRHILWNDGYRHTRASILKELELIMPMLEFNERELIALKRAETKIARMYTTILIAKTTKQT